MSTQLSKANNGKISIGRKNMFPAQQIPAATLASALKKSKVDTSASAGSGVSYLTFSGNDGSYALGPEQEDVAGCSIVINPSSFVHGWILWHQQVPTKALTSFVNELPEKIPGKGRDEAAEARGFQAAFLPVDGEEADETIIEYTTNSYGGRKAIDAVLNEMILRANGGEEVFLCPVISLESDSYMNKNYGKEIHTPSFKVLDWMSVDGTLESGTKKLEATEHEDAENSEGEAPKRRKRNVA